MRVQGPEVIKHESSRKDSSRVVEVCQLAVYSAVLLTGASAMLLSHRTLAIKTITCMVAWNAQVTVPTVHPGLGFRV